MQILRLVSGLAALLGQKAPSSAVTDTSVCACGQTMETGAAVCSECLEQSEFLIPAVCKGCGKIDHKELLDFCRDCEINGTEWVVRGGNSKIANTETDMNNGHDDLDDLLRECPCTGTGGICKTCLAFNNAHSE